MPTTRWRGIALGALSASLALAVSSCDAPPQVRSFQADDRSQLVGGPSAIGEVGDFVLENDRIRAVVLQGGNSVGPGMFGGTIVDVDLQRPERRHSAGRGHDQFAELFPMVNLVIPGYQDAGTAGIGELDVSIWSNGADGRCPLTEEEAPEGCAAIRVAGTGDRLIEALGTVELLGVLMDMSFISYYTLRPGDTYIQLRTYFWSEDQWSPTDADELELGGADEPRRLAELALFPERGENYSTLEGEVPIFQALLGDAMTIPPPTDEYYHPGLLAGDFLLFGKNVIPFGTSVLADGLAADRSGYDISYLFQRRYDRGEIVLERPMADSVLVGVGDRVSYGYMSASGAVVVPILTGSFTGAFTHRYQCVTAGGGEDCGDETARPLAYNRFLVVGDGDVASVLEVYFDMNGTETGRVSGHVIDEISGAPMEDAKVFALLDPRVWNEDADISTYDAATESLRALDFNEDGEADDNPSIVSFAATDTGYDRVPDGSWTMRLEPGDYLLVASVSGRHLSRPVPVTVAGGQHEEHTMAVPPAGRLYYEIFDDRGDHATGKLTFIGPLADDATCPMDFRDPSMIPALSELRHLELGSSERPQGIATVVYSQSGRGHVDLAPGRYDVIASRGFEYSIDRQCLDLHHDTAPTASFSVLREVDSTGWVAGDFHVHGVNSYDGNMPHEQRVISAIAEGLEVFATTDHDYITNMEPVIWDVDARDQVSSMVGVEITPIELGHILGYPLSFDETAVDNGAPDWTRRDVCLDQPDAFGCPDGPVGYLGLTPDEIFQALRELGEFGPEHTVVTVPHPRDGFFGYFDQFALNHFDLVLEDPGLVRGENPLLDWFPPRASGNERYRLYSENFDAVELFNGARYETIRTPTVAEVTDFARELAAAAEAATSEQDFAIRMAGIHDQTVRRVLVRTQAEQSRMRYDHFIECVEHSDCAEGELCHPDRAFCFPDELGPCSSEEDCPDGMLCVPAVVSGSNGSRCLEACDSDEDCHINEYCSLNTGRCAAASCNIGDGGVPLPEGEGPEAGDRPCIRNREPHSEGVIDDWFRLLNYGVFYTGMANSDTHTPSSEIGLPRNYVSSSTDAPAMLDHQELADNIRAGRVVASYGPFIELTVEGGSIGDTVEAEGEVELHLRVQSASWFDVDRIEVYANGQLLCDIGHQAETPCDTDAELALDAEGQNTDIVNFDGVIRHDPEVDTWYAVVAMGISEQARGLSPVYFASLHPNLGFSEIIGQAFASFDVPFLAAVVPPPVARAEVNLMVPYAITNPVWVESARDEDDLWRPPLGLGDVDDPEAHGVPPYRRHVLCQHVSSERSVNTAGCRDETMPLSTESLGTSPFATPEQRDAESARWQRFNMIRRALMRLGGGGC